MKFLPQLASELDVQDLALLEKDVRLHQLLHHFTQESDIRQDLVFKGGTCLIKCHLNYPRFSVDLDFTWKGDGAWSEFGATKVRDATRNARRSWQQSLLRAAKAFRYQFDKTRIEWGSSSRMGTAYFYYKSMDGEPSMIKIQVNFVELRVREDVMRAAHSLISRNPPFAAELLEDLDLDVYRQSFPVRCYHPEEIAAEKCRAILTRKVAKGRDVLDLFLLQYELETSVEDLEQEIHTKLNFATGLGHKYQSNMEDAKKHLRILSDEDIRPLLLKEIDVTEFQRYRDRILPFLEKILGDQNRPPASGPDL